MFSFLSIEFALLFIAFLAVYWAFRQKPHWQNILLIIISYLVIYLMAGIVAISVLFGYTVLVYFISQAITRSTDKKKTWLITGIVITLLQLSLFKYYDFFRESVKFAMQAMQLDTSGLMANILSPLVISY